MSLNFQDVIRDVHNPSTHTLQVAGTTSVGNETVTINSAPTIYAVVNTAAAGDSVNNIGFATVSVSNPTLYAVVNTTASSGFETIFVGTPTLFAVVNTSAPGITNAIATIANFPTSTQIVGNITINSGSISVLGNLTLSDSKSYIGLTSVRGSVELNAGVNGIGFATVNISTSANFIGLMSVQGNARVWGNTAGDGSGTNKAILVDNDGNLQVDVANGISSSITGNLTLSDSKAYIGLVSVSGTVGLGNSVSNIGFATVTPTTTTRSIAGNLTLSDSKGYIGLVSVSMAAWADPKTYIGLVTVANTVPVTFSGNVTITDSKSFIGLTTTVIGSTPTLFAVVNTGAAGQSSVVVDSSVNWIGFATVANINQPALVASAAYIGLASVNIGGTLPALTAGVANIGFMTVTNAVAWPNPNTFIGLVTVAPHALTASTINIGSVSVLGGIIALRGNVTLSGPLPTGTLNIGSVSVLGGTIKLAEPNVFVGLVTCVNGLGTQFIGLVTANAVNTGTNKTLITLPIAINNSSVATIAVPTNANSIKICNLLLNSDATVRVTFKSGVTYLTGNASIGLTLSPTGGWMQPGSPDSPSWIGLPSGAFVIEKLDLTATSSKIGGHVVYFQE